MLLFYVMSCFVIFLLPFGIINDKADDGGMVYGGNGTDDIV